MDFGEKKYIYYLALFRKSSTTCSRRKASIMELSIYETLYAPNISPYPEF
jgi:hypothetical protein